MNKKIDVDIFNGRIKMMTCTVSGREENIEKIRCAIEAGDIFDVSGSNIKLAYNEKASSFIKKFDL